MADSNLQVTQVANFYRLSEIIRQSLPHLREVFKSLYRKLFTVEWSSEKGPALLEFCDSKHWNKKVNKKIKSGNVDEWDITTLSFVILRLAKDKEKDAMAELRNFRNALSHHTNNGMVTDGEYKENVGQLRDYFCVLGMGKTEMDQIIGTAEALNFYEQKTINQMQLEDYAAALGFDGIDPNEEMLIRMPGPVQNVSIGHGIIRVDNQTIERYSSDWQMQVLNVGETVIDKFCSFLLNHHGVSDISAPEQQNPNIQLTSLCPEVLPINNIFNKIASTATVLARNNPGTPGDFVGPLVTDFRDALFNEIIMESNDEDTSNSTCGNATVTEIELDTEELD